MALPVRCQWLDDAGCQRHRRSPPDRLQVALLSVEVQVLEPLEPTPSSRKCMIFQRPPLILLWVNINGLYCIYFFLGVCDIIFGLWCSNYCRA